MAHFRRISHLTPVPEQAWLRMYRTEAAQEQNGKCLYCYIPLHADNVSGEHRMARHNGGSTTRKNIGAACRECNNAKQHMSEAAFLKKVKSPKRGDGLGVFLAHFRRRLWLRTHRACAHILKVAA
jgi:5-methylcytosine-specific restriction endonuclease McrA